MINYQLIADSIKYYESKGFQRVEVPWTVTKPVSDITRPLGAGEFTIKEKDKVLVASGEQGFLYQYLKGFLPKGKYQATTPCFRNEIFDNWHTKYFIKNELIITDIKEQSLDEIVEAALGFYQTLFPKERLRIRKTGSISYDIEYRANESEFIELGSYGFRECEFLKWVYGTGLAENRTSRVIELLNKI